MGNIVEVEPDKIASIELPGARQLEFYAVPEDGEIEIVEIAPSGEEAMYVGKKRDLIDIYLEVAPEGSPVPKVFLDVASADTRAESDFIAEDTFKSTIIEDQQILGLTEPVQAASVGYCTNSPAGVLYFTQHSCKSQNLRNSFCDPGSHISGGGWLELVRQSSDKKRKSYSRTAACGGTGQAKHYYWSSFSGSWKTKRTYEIGANSQIWREAKGASKRFRRIRHKTHHPLTGGFIRAWSEFYN